MEILSSGAEAIIYKAGRRVIKDRIKKRYRHEELDLKLRLQRTKTEAKILKKLEDLNVPKLLEVDKTKLILTYIPGKKLSSYSVLRKKHIIQLAKLVAKIHERNVIHHDLTTSNFLVYGGNLYLIDFGLSFISHKLEDKAVDLHLLREALESKHYKSYGWTWPLILEIYAKEYKEGQKVIERLKIVEKRGRYKGKK